MAVITIEIELDEVKGLKCQECDETVTLDEVVSPLYECGNCGTLFTRESSYDQSSHRCPDCQKFSSKIAEQGCPECNAGELEEVDGFECPQCDEFVTVEDMPDHLAEHLR